MIYYPREALKFELLCQKRDHVHCGSVSQIIRGGGRASRVYSRAAQKIVIQFYTRQREAGKYYLSQILTIEEIECKNCD